MTFLDFPGSPAKASLIKSHEKQSQPAVAERILTRAPPKIEPMRSEVLSRAAAFLPQLAASNRAILQKRPEDVNIESLKGDESEIIEMKLGLGVFEEKRSSSCSSDESSSSDSDCSMKDGKKKRILVLPSEIRAAAQAESTKIDPFERVINSLLLFDGSSDEEDAESGHSECDGNMEILDFE